MPYLGHADIARRVQHPRIDGPGLERLDLLQPCSLQLLAGQHGAVPCPRQLIGLKVERLVMQLKSSAATQANTGEG